MAKKTKVGGGKKKVSKGKKGHMMLHAKLARGMDIENGNS